MKTSMEEGSCLSNLVNMHIRFSSEYKQRKAGFILCEYPLRLQDYDILGITSIGYGYRDLVYLSIRYGTNPENLIWEIAAILCGKSSRNCFRGEIRKIAFFLSDKVGLQRFLTAKKRSTLFINGTHYRI
jgi:hypothetical protein